MFRPLIFLVLCSAWLIADAQEQAAPAPDVVAEIDAFYSEYWKAWQERELAEVADHLAAEFTLFTYVSGQGPGQLDKSSSVESVRQFFEAIRNQEVFWSHTVLGLEPRSETEAIVTVRNRFSWKDGRGETELSLEVLRKSLDGRWRLLRKWSEKHAY